jgi:hypothetical protein
MVLPFALLKNNFFKILWDIAPSPTGPGLHNEHGPALYAEHGDALWVAVNSFSFIQWHPDMAKEGAKPLETTEELPKHPPEYLHHMEAPAEYIPYLTSVSDNYRDEAEAFAESTFPSEVNDQCYELFSGAVGAWTIDGKLWNYIYYLLPGETKEKNKLQSAVPIMTQAAKEAFLIRRAREIEEMNERNARLASDAAAEEVERLKRIAVNTAYLDSLGPTKPKPKPVAQPLGDPALASNPPVEPLPLADLLGPSELE